MKKSVVLNSFIKNVALTKSALEKVEVVSERDQNTFFNSKTQTFAEGIKYNLIDGLSQRFKNYQFQILVYADENVDEFNVILSEVYIEKIKDIKNELLVNLVKEATFGRVDNVIVVNKLDLVMDSLTENQIVCQKWSDRIQNYLANTYDFKGTTKISAVFAGKRCIVFDITLSGKGTNNYLVDKSKKIKPTKLNISDNAIDTIIFNAFEES